MKLLSADAIVVGAGAGGGFIAAALAEAGISVLLIERGPWFDHETSFPMRHSDWEQRRRAFPASVLSDSSIEFTHGPAIPEIDLDLCSRTSLDKLEKRTNRGRFNYHRVQGIGGSTLHYQGEAHRFPEHAFKTRTLLGFGIDWPLDYSDLEPFYEQAEKWLGVAGTPGNPFKAARGKFPTPGHGLSTKSQWIQKGADQLGWHLLPNTLALPSISYDGRIPCQHSGGCALGCPFGAKSSVDRAVLPRATSTGNLQVLDGAQVIDIECNSAKSVKSIVFTRRGEKHRAVADRYILAGGAIETPRLLLTSQSSHHPRGIGNAFDRVGRNLMETIFSVLSIEADRPVYAWKGAPIDSRLWDFNSPLAGSGLNGFVLGVSGTMTGYHGPVSYAKRTGGFGRQHKDAMRAKFGRIVNLFGIADHAPNDENRIQLGDDVDDQGVPKVRITSDYYQRDKRTLRQMISRMTELAEACRPENITNLSSTYSNSSATHLAGTCLMGADPEHSVTTPFGQVHGMDNLFIADASVLPGQGMGDSPSLTIQALALRTAAYIIENRSNT